MLENIPPPVRPGAGVDVRRLPMADTLTRLRDSSYVLDAGLQQEVADIQARVDSGNPDSVSQRSIGELLFRDDAKTFRNAFTALVVENAWPEYKEAVDGKDPGVFTIAVDNAGVTSLVPAPVADFGAMPLAEVGRHLAISNQATLSHFVCRQFLGGRIPRISGQRETDRSYLRAFAGQTRLISFLDSEFRTLPSSVGSPSVFVASGSITLRTQLFGLANLIDTFSTRDNLNLTNEQHRTGVDNSIRRILLPFLLPISPISVGVNHHVVDPHTKELLADRWIHNGDSDNLLVS